MAALYAPDAHFRSEPFRDAQDPGAYASWAFRLEGESPDVRFGRPRVSADGCAAVEYWAVVEGEEGEGTIAGVSLLRFDDTGLVVEERDYWNEAKGGREPPPGWGG